MDSQTIAYALYPPGSFLKFQSSCRLAHSVPRRRQYSQILAASQQQPPRLVLYSKSDCHLCDGLKEKINGVLAKAQYMPSPLTNAELEVRDITSNPEWEKEYGMVIPILKVVLPGTNKEVKVKRMPPRSSADRVSQHILEAMGFPRD